MKIVLCEGNEDVNVVRGVCIASGIEGLVFEHCGGRNNLETYLRGMPNRGEFVRGEVESLAVLIDAETSSESAWRKIQGAVSLGFHVQLESPAEFSGELPKIGGFVIAGSQGKGMLEDMCLDAVREKPGYSCLELYFTCLAESTEVKEYHAKAKFRAWMASQKDFELGVTLAVQRGYIPWEHQCFHPLREFLRNV